MKRKTKILLASVVAVPLIGAGLLATSAMAQGSSNMNSLVSEIATKFHLNQSDVQAVFDQHKQEMQTQHEQLLQDKLSQAVTDGSITSAQKDLITNKLKDVQNQLTQIRAITDQSARQTAMQQLRTDLQTWATQNNIDTKWLRGQAGRMRGGGMYGGMHGMMGSGT